MLRTSISSTNMTLATADLTMDCYLQHRKQYGCLFPDPIYGHAHLGPLAMEFLDSSAVQRLRHLKQLGCASYAFPTAEHSRFVHSLGVGYLAAQCTLGLRDTGLDVRPADVELLEIAGGHVTHLIQYPGLRGVHEQLVCCTPGSPLQSVPFVLQILSVLYFPQVCVMIWDMGHSAMFLKGSFCQQCSVSIPGKSASADNTLSPALQRQLPQLWCSEPHMSSSKPWVLQWL